MSNIGCTGHQKMPAAAVKYATDHIEETLRQCTDEVLGITSLAIGADQIFAKQVLAHGGKLCAVIPCARYEETFDAATLAEFHSLLNQATCVSQLEFDEPSEDAFFAAGRFIVDHCELLVAVWDGEPARGLGGTADVVKYAKENGTAVNIVWPPNVGRD
jgi:hypothetical protein